MAPRKQTFVKVAGLAAAVVLIACHPAHAVDASTPARPAAAPACHVNTGWTVLMAVRGVFLTEAAEVDFHALLR
jgi:invasion protein IalB